MALVLGAPGVYQAPEEPDNSYRGVRLDVAGFVGIAPRGPARRDPVARAVDSWSAYQEIYGGFERPGRLPYAVATFFEQGGRRAYIVRAVPWDGDGTGRDATAGHVLDGVTAGAGLPIGFDADNEGSWGTDLRLTLEFAVTHEFVVWAESQSVLPSPTGLPPGDAQNMTRLVLPEGIDVPVGSTLRVRCRGRFPAVGVLCRVVGNEVHDIGPGTVPVRSIDLSPPPPMDSAPDGEPLPQFDVGVVSGTLIVDHADPGFRPRERFEQLGLHPDHPRWLWSVVSDSSALVQPTEGWRTASINVTDPLLPPARSSADRPGVDVEERIDVDRDFFDPDWDPLVEDRTWRGVHALAEIEEIGQLLVPDLFWAPAEEPIPVPAPPVPCRPVFEPCRPVPVGPEPPPPVGYLLDGSTVASFQLLVGRQRRLVELVERLQRLVVLLDVPQRMPVSRIEQWRAAFDSSYAAGYHPWLLSDRFDDERASLIDIPPSAAAAGVIAARENLRGVAVGPANELIQGVTNVDADLSDELHDRLHLQGINVFRRHAVGVRLTAARTLSSDAALRQLSVRRLMLKIRLTLERESQWMVFEPNNELLWGEIRWYATLFLRQLYLGGAFTGATEAEAFFVHCDDRLNPPALLTAGQLHVEIGVAPAEPLEYLVVRIARQRDGSLTAEETGG